MSRYTRRGIRKGVPAKRIQPRVLGITRQRIGAAVSHAIEAAIQGDMRRFNVSRSFVVAVHLADSYGIPLADVEDYRYASSRQRSK